MFDLRILGPVEAVVDDAIVDVGGGRPLRALVALAVAGRTLSIDELAERCFDDTDRPDEATAAIRMAVRRLRSALGADAVETRTGGYELGPHNTDMAEFERLVERGRASDDPVAVTTHMRRAVELWRGPPFGSLGDLDWVHGEQVRLETLHITALESLFEARLRSGAVTEVLPDLGRAVTEHPFQDRLRRQLMLALFRAGRQVEALRAAQDYRSLLSESGLDPSDATVRLERRIAEGDTSLMSDGDARSLRGYRLNDRLGEGAFSVVYQGTQPSVGRDVAIKQIRAELANRVEFIRRFEAEARMVAHLEHPHIVPLIDYWREPGSAYLVMRLLRGGSLESAVIGSPWDLDRVLRMVEQIGAALASAHRVGVVHRDVKSANIMLDDDGNAYLTDFGIALEAADAADPEAALSAGSPAYASPEQLRREGVGPSADVHGLAIATYEALVGRLPFPDEPNQAALLQRQLHDPIPLVQNSRPDIPTAVDDVLQKATAKSPGDRYQEVGDFVKALADACGPTPIVSAGSRATAIHLDDRNPYKGLRPFDEADARDFAGRDRLIDQLVDTVDQRRVVAVVGPSGSGKSSVVRAGLLPALRRGRVVGSDAWFVVTMVPGQRPFEELEAGLMRIASDRPMGLLALLQDGDRGVGRAVRQLLPEHGQLLLVIDQFEELFTLCDDDSVRRQFLDALVSAVTEERSRLRVVLTLRADFYDRPLRYESVGRIIRDATVTVLPLAPDELERAIVDPAQAVGADFEPGLVSEIVADVADQPGALPMLQYALTELYDRRASGLMLRAAYRELGGVTGALALKAEQLHDAESVDGQAAARSVFGRLVSLGEGTADTRRRALRSELASIPGADEIVDTYGAARLLTFDTDPNTREPTVEVAHEALIGEWPRLATWLDDDRDGLRIQRHLHSASVEWDDSGRPPSELYRGGRLEAAEQWADTADLTAVEGNFLDASVQRRADEQEAQRRSTRRLQRLLAAVAVVATIALIAGAIAVRQQRRASDQASESDFRRLVAESANQIDVDTRRALLMAVEAHTIDPGPESLGAIQRVLVRSERNWLGSLGGAVDNYSGAAFVDSDRLAVAGPEGVDIFSLESRTITASFPFARALTADQREVVEGSKVDVSDDRSIVLATSLAGEWQVVDSESGDVIRSGFLEDNIRAAVIAPDATSLALATQSKDGDGKISDETVHWIDLADGGVGWTAPVDGSPRVLTFDDGTQRLAVLTSDGPTSAATIIDVRTGITTVRIPLNAGTFGPVAGAWRGSELLVVGTDGIFLVDPEAPDRLTHLDAAETQNGRAALDIGSDGTLAIVHGDFIELLGTDSDNLEFVTAEGAVSSEDIAYDSDTGTLAMVGSEGVTLSSVRGAGVLVEHTLPGPGPAEITEDGTAIVVSSDYQPPLEAWSIEAGTVTPEGPIADQAWALSRQDRFVVIEWITAGTRQAGLWKGDSVVLLGGETSVPVTMGLSPDGRWVAIATFGDGAVHIHDAQSGEVVAELDAVLDASPPGLDPRGLYATDLEFTSDGAELVVAIRAANEVRFYDTTTWTESRPALTGDESFNDIDFASDDSFALTYDFDRGLELRSMPSLELVVGPYRPLLDFGLGGHNPDILAGDKYAVLASKVEGAIIVDIENFVQVGDPFPYETTFSQAPVASEAKKLVTYEDGNTLVWNIDVDAWPEVACRAAGRNLTPQEWEDFGPDRPYRKTCPQFP